ncbi:hypothetical protein HPB47_010750, partial [Ixodes persulcatus]
TDPAASERCAVADSEWLAAAQVRATRRQKNDDDAPRSSLGDWADLARVGGLRRHGDPVQGPPACFAFSFPSFLHPQFEPGALLLPPLGMSFHDTAPPRFSRARPTVAATFSCPVAEAMHPRASG